MDIGHWVCYWTDCHLSTLHARKGSHSGGDRRPSMPKKNVRPYGQSRVYDDVIIPLQYHLFPLSIFQWLNRSLVSLVSVFFFFKHCKQDPRVWKEQALLSRFIADLHVQALLMLWKRSSDSNRSNLCWWTLSMSLLEAKCVAVPVLLV